MTAARLALSALALAGAPGVVSLLSGCNSVLGIEHASLEDAATDGPIPAEASAVETGSSSDGAGIDGAGIDGGQIDGGQIDGADPLTCANYCSVIMQNCTGVHQEYLSNDVCMALCKYMQPGVFYPPASEPDNVDTLGCRLWHANVAPTNPTVHCRHAGPMGTELCGGPCNPFCSLDWHFCTDDNGINVYAGQVPGCENACSGDGGFVYVEGDSGDLNDPSGAAIETGDTLNCRLWHLETAVATGSTTTHCPHTGVVSFTCQ